MDGTKRILIVLWVMMLNAIPSVCVVHLDGKYASVQVAGASVAAPQAVYQPYSVPIQVIKENPAMDGRIKRLEKLIRNLTSAVEQAEQARHVDETARIKLEKEKQKRVQDKGPLEGLVHVANKELSDIRFGEKAVTLSLDGNARVVCAQAPLVLRSTDTIIVRGQGNELVIPTSMECIGDVVFAEENAELTITLASHAKLTMQQASGALQLSPDAVFICRGAGTLNFTSNCGILFDRKPSGARVVLTDGLHVTMTGNILQCGGVGSLVLDKGATFDINADQQCIIGLDSQDYMNVIVQGSAGIVVSPRAGGLAFHKGAYDLSVIEKGFINVGQGAALCLQNPYVAQSAICKSFTVARGGRLRVLPQGVLVIKKQQEACAVDIEEQAIEADGHLSYEGMRSLVLMQRHGAVNRTCSLGGLVRTLINKKPTFSWATVFEDINKQSWVFLPAQNIEQQLEQGQYIKLNGNEIVTTENAKARKVFGVAQGNAIEVSDSGVLFNIPRIRSIFLGSADSGLASLRAFFADEEHCS